MVDVLACLFNSLRYKQYATYRSELGLVFVPEETFRRLRKKLTELVETIAKSIFDQNKAEVKRRGEAGETLGVSVDEAWHTRGFQSQHGVMYVLALSQLSKEKHILNTIIKSKPRFMNNKAVGFYNHTGSSKSMEGSSLDKALQELRKDNLIQYLPNVVGNQDSGINKVVREFYTRLGLEYAVIHDPGHKSI